MNRSGTFWFGSSFAGTALGSAERSDAAALVRAFDPSIAATIQSGMLETFGFCDQSGRRVGFGGLRIEHGSALLGGVVTLPALRGLGYGGYITLWLLRAARSAGASQAYLATENARGFFEKWGFETVDRLRLPDWVRGALNADGFSQDVTMRRRLAAD